MIKHLLEDDTLVTGYIHFASLVYVPGLGVGMTLPFGCTSNDRR